MLKILKIGGNIVDNPSKLDRFLEDFACIPGPKILVHGGGKIATHISQSLGIETRMIEGRRVTDEETLKVVTMVYAGVINKTIVNKLNAAGCPAVGLCGADGDLILSRRRSPVPVDYGMVGDPESVNMPLVSMFMDGGYTLVVAPITASVDGGLLNTNADTVASALAVAVACAVREGTVVADADGVELIYCFEKRGVLRNVDDPDSVVANIDPVSFETLRAGGVVAGGMIPKLENAFKAIHQGVSKVVICSAEAISMPGYGGTSIVGCDKES